MKQCRTNDRDNKSHGFAFVKRDETQHEQPCRYGGAYLYHLVKNEKMAHVNGDRTKQKIGQFADGQQLERNPQKSIHEKQMNVIAITGMNCCCDPLESRLDSYPAEVPEIRNINFVIAVRQTVFRIATAESRQKEKYDTRNE